MDSLNITYTAAAIIALLAGGWLKIRPTLKRRAAADNAILGKAEVTDRAGRVMEPAQPGLIHVTRENSNRVTKVEEAVIEFRHAIGIYTEVLKRVDTVERDVAYLKDNYVKDIVTAAERAATAAASAEMLRLANERDTIDGEAD